MILTFEDFKQKISIIDIAIFLGYKFDRTKGLNQPSFVLSDGHGNINDRIYIKNPNDKAKQGYWRRGLNSFGKQKGDLIGFVRENLNSFHETRNSQNEIDAINKILLSFLNINVENDVTKQYTRFNKKSNQFDINRYERENNNIEFLMNFFDKRNINRDTVDIFNHYIEIIKDKYSKYNYRNIGFPYTIPGNDKIVGYEVRGISNFKSKVEGTDSVNAAWIADFCEEKTSARYVFFGESAYDMMAFYQINKAKLKLENCVFVSTGGSFSDNQIKSIIQYYNTSKPVFCFDNDINGIMYDIRAFCLIINKELQTSINGNNVLFNMNNKSFEIETNKLTLKSFLNMSRLHNENLVDIMKPPKEFKDWNEVLTKKTNELEILNRYDLNLKLKR